MPELERRWHVLGLIVVSEVQADGVTGLEAARVRHEPRDTKRLWKPGDKH